MYMMQTIICDLQSLQVRYRNNKMCFNVTYILKQNIQHYVTLCPPATVMNTIGL